MSILKSIETKIRKFKLHVKEREKKIEKNREKGMKIKTMKRERKKE